MTSFDFAEGEVILINKPYRWTSFDVVNNLRSFLKHHAGYPKLKIGHAGTLDPLATGLLIVCTGLFTKRIEEFQGLEKEYSGIFTLGATTPCFDLEQEIDHTWPVEHITNEAILETARKLTGTYEQVPPVFSAKKIGGRRAYKYARNQEEIIIRPNLITVSEFQITSVEMPDVHFRIVCSKGTYIRAIARDFGLALNSGAYLKSLKRDRIGNFNLRDAWDLEELKKQINSV